MLDNIPSKDLGAKFEFRIPGPWRVLECGSTGRASHCLPGPPQLTACFLFASHPVAVCTHIASLLVHIHNSSTPSPKLLCSSAMPGLRVVHAAKGLLKWRDWGGGVAIWAKNLGIPGTSHGVKKGRWGPLSEGHPGLQTTYLIRGAWTE